MPYEVKTPLPLLVAAISFWVIDGIKAKRLTPKEAEAVNRFAGAVNKLPVRLLVGSPEPRPADRDAIAKLVKAWESLPALMQARVAELACQRHFADRLEVWLGPLSEQGEFDLLVKPGPEPMF